MELDDFKVVWTEFDKKLSANYKLNEELLKRNTLNSSNKELKKPLNIAIMNVVLGFLGIIYMTALSIQNIEELKFCIPGFFSVFILLVYLLFPIITVKKLLSIDYIESPIIKLRKDIVNTNMLIQKNRKYEYFLVPFLICSLVPILYKSVLNIDIYNDIQRYALEVLIMIAISFLGGMCMNKYFVDQKISNALRVLEELEKFEIED